MPKNRASAGDSGFIAPGSRWVLILGFGGLLAITALGGADTLRVLREVRREDRDTRKQFLERNGVLNEIRSELYLSGTYVRDFLLDPDPVRASEYRTSLRTVRTGMDNALAGYRAQLSGDETRHYEELHAELANYWNTIEPILNWNSAERQRDGYRFLRDDVFPRRSTMLATAARIAEINEMQLAVGNQRIVGLLENFQTRLAIILLTTLILGLLMAAFSGRRILRLETHSQARFKEVEEARAQLASLSARLVKAQESERGAVSRELHDEVGQSLSAVLVELRNLTNGLPWRSEEESRGQIELIRGLVENTVRVVRNISLLLRPSMLDDLGLLPALRWQAREASKRTSMDVAVEADVDGEDLPDDYKTCIYRVVQEALHNCSRHSHASTVEIRVHRQGDMLNLSIEDNGTGFDIKQSKGMGLLGIEERIAQLGGKCRISSSLGRGTTLSATLPLPKQREIHEAYSREAC